jgi:HK97 gp10 family phage protein
MQDPTGIKVQGLRQAIRALQDIGVPAAEIKAAGTQSGELVANEARSQVPVKTGRLRDSIRVSKALSKISVSAGNNTRIPYANPIHWGWYRRHIKPQPFFVKALGITRDQVYQNYYSSLDRLIASKSTKGIPTS